MLFKAVPLKNWKLKATELYLTNIFKDIVQEIVVTQYEPFVYLFQCALLYVGLFHLGLQLFLPSAFIMCVFYMAVS